jgi:hypothetical protein
MKFQSIAWRVLFEATSWIAPSLIARVVSRAVGEWQPDGSVNRSVPIGKDDRLTILVLEPTQFRGDLDFLSASGKVRVLELPVEWTNRLMFRFFPHGKRIKDYANPDFGSEMAKSKDRYRAFLGKFLPYLFKRFDVKILVTHHAYRKASVHLGPVANELGTPYIAFHRESMLASKSRHEYVTDMLHKHGPFEGSHIVVHNDEAARTFVDAGFVDHDKISSLGCIRMDGFLDRLDRLKEKPQKVNVRKKFAFFTFGMSAGLDNSLYSYFCDVHILLAKFAISHPEIDVVMKSKTMEYWGKFIDDIFRDAGIDQHDIPNFVMTAEVDAQDLILESDVVSGLNSTVLLEAGLAGKPVVVPYFGALREEKYEDGILFLEDFENFDVPSTGKEYLEMVLHRFENPEIEPHVMDSRRALFQKHVSNLNGGTCERYVNLLQNKAHDAVL